MQVGLILAHGISVAIIAANCTAPAWAATPLYGVSFGGPQGSVLYQVNPQTGHASSAKTTGFDHVVGIAFQNDTDLYGLTNSSSSVSPSSLIRIDPATGASQVVGSTGLDSILEGDLACDASTGILYGLYQLTAGQRQLFIVDTVTGAATTLPGSLPGDPSGMAFDATGALYVLDNGLARLLHVDKTTGETLSSVALSRGLGGVAGMAIDPATGTFYIADSGSGDEDGARLYTLDPLTGLLTDVGPTQALAGLAFVPEPGSLLLVAGGWLLLSCRRRAGTLI